MGFVCNSLSIFFLNSVILILLLVTVVNNENAFNKILYLIEFRMLFYDTTSLIVEVVKDMNPSINHKYQQILWPYYNPIPFVI